MPAPQLSATARLLRSDICVRGNRSEHPAQPSVRSLLRRLPVSVRPRLEEGDMATCASVPDRVWEMPLTHSSASAGLSASRVSWAYCLELLERVLTSFGLG